MFCNKCGKEISDEATFCTGCGTQTKTTGDSKGFRKPRIPVLNKKLITIIGTVIILIIVVSVAWPSGGGDDAGSETEAVTGSIDLGDEMNLVTETIDPSGGTIIFDQPGDSLDGFQIEVPAGAYANPRQFDVSYSPISDHSFGDDFNPISPLISIENGGGYSDELIHVTIPVEVPEGQFAMAFIYDEVTGTLEGVPTVYLDENSITVATRHFSDFIISMIDDYLLMGDIDSGFKPGVDDWQFTNRGSYISPKGHCWGQSTTAMWYYVEKSASEGSLYELYDNNGNAKTPNIWQDDSLGYRLASTVQEDEKTNRIMLDISKYVAPNDKLTYKSFAYAMLLTGEPQYVRIRQSNGNSVHAMVVYRAKDNVLYIADPNYPANPDRKIEMINDTFKPYNSGANFEAIQRGEGKAYDKIDYLAKTTFINWDQIGVRWAELENGTIGNDRFPPYQLNFVPINLDRFPLEDGISTDAKVAWIEAVSSVNGANIDWNTKVFRDGTLLKWNADGSYDLEPGANNLGIVVYAKANNRYKYVDFKYYTIYRDTLTIEPAVLEGSLEEAHTFVAKDESLPKNVRFEWDMGDGSPLQMDGSDQISHQFTDHGKYYVTLTVYDEDTGEIHGRATAEVLIRDQSGSVLDYLHQQNLAHVILNTEMIFHKWHVTLGEEMATYTYELAAPATWAQSSFPITWDGTSFYGELGSGSPETIGTLNTIQGTVSPDGTVVTSIVTSYRFRDEGTDWITTRSKDMEFANIPLECWYPASEPPECSKSTWIRGDAVQQHVVKIEVEEQTTRNGQLEYDYSYVSTNWSADPTLIVSFRRSD
ncbi:MAG: PKD domain-containing protein [Chloroflexi bacterium]|nr:PKD domain-containing protein [Chloroflexota bacterium]